MTYNPTLSNPGQENAGGATDALFLKQYAGEVMTAFNQSNRMLDLGMVKTISNGKTTSFPQIGIASAKYHTPGQSLLDSANTYGTAFKHAEAKISVDDILLASTFIPDIQEWMIHYETRAEYAKQMGEVLARQVDRRLIACAALAGGGLTSWDGSTFNTDYTPLPDAGLNSATVNAATAGSWLADLNLNNTTAGTVNGGIFGCIWTTARIFDEAKIPAGDRYIVMRPEMFYRLYNQSNTAGLVIINNDVGASSNGNALAPKMAIQYAGFTIIPVQQAAQSDSKLCTLGLGGTAATGDGTNISGIGPAGNTDKYDVDLKQICAVAFHKSAIGTVKLKDLSIQTEYSVERQGTLLVARYAMGHAVLRPDAAIRWTPYSVA
jgi:hypothetical protein